MTTGGIHSISRIRTFDDDIARAKGITPSKAPKLEKQKETAQSIADAALKNDIRSATDFISVTDENTVEIPPAQLLPKKEIPTLHAKEKKVPSAPTPKAQTVPLPKKPKQIKTQTLEEDIQKINKQTSSSTLTAESVVYDASNNDLVEGTLVTNKKKHNFRLFPAIAVAIHSWFSSTATKMTKEKKPEHTISTAESRIETITQAARASKHAPQNDHGIVVKRLTKTKRKTKKDTLTITKKEEVPAPQWSTSAPAEVLPTPKKITPVPEVVIPEEILSKEEPVPEEVLPQETIPKPVKVPLPPQEKRKEEKKKKPVKKKVSSKKRTYRETPSKTSGVPIYIYLIVIAGASLLGIGATIYWFASVTPTQEVTILRIPSLFAADVEVAVPLEISKGASLSTILDASLTTRETIQIYPTLINESGIMIPADAQTILATLELRAPGSFTRAITDLTFGSYNGTEPFILMKATNFDTAFGGMLAWEPDLSADLAPLFGLPVTQSFDPYARTDTQIRSAFFRDTVVSNKSVRVLVDTQDNERILYAFVTPTIILIAPNTETFNAILPLVTQ